MSDFPHVTAAYAQSLDGCIATSSGDSQWISCDETLVFAHQLRADSDAIMVGIGTVLADDPQLTCRHVDGSSPVRVVLDSKLRIPLASKLVRSAGNPATVVCCDPALVHSPKAGQLTDAGVTLITAPSSPAGLVLHDVLSGLAKLSLHKVLVEGGCGVLTSLFRYNLVHELVVVCAPMVIGGGQTAIGDLGFSRLADVPRGTPVSVESCGRDIVWRVRFAD